jgi:RND family efflux transporter MFP subunit
MKKGIYIIFIVIMYTLIGCSAKESHHEQVKLEPINVKTQKVMAGPVDQFFSASGNIQPIKEATISTRMMGYVEQVNVRVGSKINKGQVLVSVSNSDLEAKLAQVKANIIKAEVGLENAEKDYNRMTTLYSQNSVTQKELDDITAHYNMAKAGLEAVRQMENEVKSQFKYTRITAPFSGTITEKYINAGDMANPGMPLLKLATTNAYQAVAMVPENKISRIFKGQKADVWIKSLKADIPGTVEEIAISSNNTGGQYMVKIKLDKPDIALYSGMFVTVLFEFSGEATEKIILIPEASLVFKGGLKGVYTVSDENVAILRWLILGKKIGGQYEVLSGLGEGEEIILEHETKIYNGAPIVTL